MSHPEELFRAGLVRYLSNQPDIVVFADCAHNGDAVAHCEAHSPLVLLCDGYYEQLPTQQLVRQLKIRCPQTRVLVIGREDLDQESALRCGAWGVISRSSSGDLFCRAVRVVGSGQYWVGREVLSELARKALNPQNPPPKVKRVLSAREAEILALVGAGKTNEQIAEALYIEVNTVRTHLRRIYQKLGVHDRTSAVVKASRDGHIQLHPR